MTIQNKTTLKTFFEQNDIPQGTDYANLIDSQVNLAETALQSMAGPLACTELITARVSAANVVFAGTNFALQVTGNAVVGANNYNVSAANHTVSASNSINFAADNGINLQYGDAATGAQFTMGANVNLINKLGNIVLSAGGTMTIGAQSIISFATPSLVSFNSLVAASALRVTTQVSANKAYVTDGIFQPPAIVSAAGTTQGAATVVSAPIARLAGVNDGTATGFALMANRTGQTQILYNQTAVSANLWPPTGGTINGLGANAAFALAANTMYTVAHIAASAYAVK